MPPARKRILFLVPYPLGIAPSQRFRFEQYLHLMEAAGLDYLVRPFLDSQAMGVLYSPGNHGLKAWKVAAGLVGRIADLWHARKADIVFIHREAAPIGPPIFEWIIAKVMRKRVIFDFDDAIYLRNVSDSNPFIAYFKRYRNAESTCRWAWRASCGNGYLRDHAARFCSDARINPTTIDTEGLHNRLKQYTPGRVVIGWTGTHSTVRYLEQMTQLLQKVGQGTDFELLAISDRRPAVDLPNLRYVPWDKRTEIDDLLRMDVGLMPLDDSPWTRGKCGFKALQYMALGIPAIVSPVGVNKQIVTHGINGWVCEGPREWEECLRNILLRPEMLPSMSVAARQTVEEHYSVRSNAQNFLSLFEG